MRKYIQVIFIMILLFPGSVWAQQQEKKFRIIPENPVPGQEIKITYKNANQKNPSSVNTVIYSVNDGIIDAEQYQMKKNQKYWYCLYQIPDTIQAIGIKFIIKTNNRNSKSLTDTYPVKLYDKKGALYKGTLSACAYIVEPKNEALAYSLYKKDFSENPDLMKYYISSYCYSIKSQRNQNPTQLIKTAINRVLKEKLDESQLLSVFLLYEGLNDQNSAEKIKKVLLKRYPEGNFAGQEAYRRLNKITDPVELENSLAVYEKKYPDSNGDYSLSKILALKVLRLYCEQDRLKDAAQYFRSMKIDYNNYYWDWNVGTFAEIAKICLHEEDTSLTKEITDASLRLAHAFIKLKRPRPNWRTNEQFREMAKKFSISSFSVAAEVYDKLGEPKRAFKYAQEGYNLINYDPQLNQIYAKLLVDNGHPDMALNILDNLVLMGNPNKDLLNAEKRAYIKSKGSAIGYNRHLADLKKIFLKNFQAKVKSSMFKKKAPDFTLKDLSGKSVSLKDYRGKIVVLDFWATWCSPCKASMPTMVKAQKIYSGNRNIKFLYIDTEEHGGKPGENALKFMKMMKYPFHVLVDQGTKVADLYKVGPIPAKIFIDKKGYIRYRKVGYYPTMLTEIEAVIKNIESSEN